MALPSALVAAPVTSSRKFRWRSGVGAGLATTGAMAENYFAGEMFANELLTTMTP
jgi:hypothetical protein